MVVSYHRKRNITEKMIITLNDILWFLRNLDWSECYWIKIVNNELNWDDIDKRWSILDDNKWY